MTNVSFSLTNVLVRIQHWTNNSMRIYRPPI